MSQLLILIWLKWTLFRNSLRKSKAVVSSIASALAMLAALVFALVVAVGLGIAAYALSSPRLLQRVQEGASREMREVPSVEFMFFAFFGMIYLLWASLPLTIGSTRRFDPGNLLLYPISFRKLFAVDFVSEIASLQSVIAIPAMIAIGLGAGMARGQMMRSLIGAFAAVAFGVALSKWISMSVGSLLRKRRTGGETLLAMIGATAGLAGASFAQAAPIIFRHAGIVRALRWTPPGAIAFALTGGLDEDQTLQFFLAIVLIGVYTVIFVGLTYWLAHRMILGGGPRKARRRLTPVKERPEHTGWNFPFVSPALSAIIEKELRYALRNAQLRMIALMPLIIIVVRLMNRRAFSDTSRGSLLAEFMKYGEGLMTAGGILYVFLLLTGLSCNLFAFEHSGMRTLVLAPVNRKIMLIGKNIAITIVALVLSVALMLVSELLFDELNPGILLFAALTFITYAALISVIGNSLSISFPKRMKMGTRMNVSGVVGLLLIPIVLLMSLPPLAAVAAGFIAQSLKVEYATLSVLAALSIGLYMLVIKSQGEALQAKELEILETVTDPGSD